MENKNQNPQEIAKGCVILIVLSFFIWLFFIPSCSDDSKEEKKEPASVNIPESEIKDSTIVKGMDIFKLLFNDFAQKYGFPYKLNKIKLDSSGSAINHMFSDHLAMIAAINKNEEIISIYIITDCKEKPTNILLSFAEIIYVTNPTLLPEERGQILRDIGIIGKNIDLQHLNGSAIKNNIKYSAVYNQNLGLWFTAIKEK